jgi:hypothetical protein
MWLILKINQKLDKLMRKSDELSLPEAAD